MATTSFQPGAYPGRPYGSFAGRSPATTAAISGTITASATETAVRLGGKTIIITITSDTWVAAGAAFDAQRQAIINGLNSAQAEVFGWNNVVRAAESVTAVVRTSATVVTITLSAAPTYDITAAETITVTVPSSALATSISAVIGTPTFSISPVTSTTDTHDGPEVRKRRDEELRERIEGYRRDKGKLREAILLAVDGPQPVARAAERVMPFVASDGGRPGLDMAALEQRAEARALRVIAEYVRAAEERRAADDEDDELIFLNA